MACVGVGLDGVLGWEGSQLSSTLTSRSNWMIFGGKGMLRRVENWGGNYEKE